MQHLFTSENIISFIILVILEIVLGIDNVIFVSIIINQLDNKDEKKDRRAWMINGIIIRSILLLGLGCSEITGPWSTRLCEEDRA